jgi:hypothetical protein
MGCCPVPRMDRFQQCYHHLSAMQPLAQYLTPWLQRTKALFAVLGRPPPSPRRRLRLVFGGVVNRTSVLIIFGRNMSVQIKPRFIRGKSQMRVILKKTAFWDIESCILVEADHYRLDDGGSTYI